MLSDYYSSKMKNQKLHRIVLKMSSVAALASFLTLFVGATKTKLIDVKDSNGLTASIIGSDKLEENLKILKKSEKINLGDKDKVSLSETQGSINLFIERSVLLNVEVDGKNITLESRPDLTFEDALKNEINLKEHDEILKKQSNGEKPVSVSRKSTVEKGSFIVRRVELKKEVEIVDVAYATEFKEDNNLEKGKQVVEKQGQNGQCKKEYDVKYVNKELVEKKLVGTTTIKEPENKVVRRGTKEINDVSAAFSNSFLGKKRLREGTFIGYATYYNKGKGTASGAKLEKRRTVAADPKRFPFGTKVRVSDLKTGKVLVEDGVVTDRCETAVRSKGIHVDLYGVSFKEGKKPVKIEIKK